jgi:glycosyltransferase involved in cell wall biosynthesis
MRREISIVIPTYNRPEQLSAVLDKLLQSNISEVDRAEILVVDDGSPQPVNSVVDSKSVAAPFSLRYIQQKNAGPASARNNGFLNAENEIVLFVDDDILVDPELLREHLKTHAQFPGSVVFGVCPLAPIYDGLPTKRYFDSLQAEFEQKTGIVKRQVLASGNLSVERSQFPDGVYASELAIPGAEEFELMHRLNQLSIPIYQCFDAIGWHLQSPRIEDKCRQEMKYGFGVAERYSKMESGEEDSLISNFLRVNGYIDWQRDPLKLKLSKAAKAVASKALARKLLVRATQFLESMKMNDRILFYMYRALCGLSVFAGVREGLRKGRGQQ